MHEADETPDTAAVRQSVAERFVEARLLGRALREYPGPLPVTLAEAYARQDAAISLWPDVIAGWKVGAIADPWAARVGESRLLGPIFRRHVRHAGAEAVTLLPVIPGGFAAVEAEYVFVLGACAPPSQREWTSARAADLVAELRVGIELAGSPLATINDLGPAVVVSDFGNNAGLMLGPPIADWRSRPLECLTCETLVNGRRAGRGSAASIAGGPLAALTFALACCARRGRGLKAGDLVSTGACTGIHTVRAGDEARALFADAGELRCLMVSATPAGCRAP
ncbi:MAG TPA: fumarylacetoacetate hydrolase family protein [Steroidobacteraceae bacterium]|nr:fumarylacetoacetate hydrolase family protein [Steroidobacteraceae bacterium]